MLQVPKHANETIVSSLNLFLDSSNITSQIGSDTKAPDGDSGANCTFNMGGSTIVAGPGQTIRLSLLQFNAYNNIPMVHVNNNDQLVTINDATMLTGTAVYEDLSAPINPGYYGSPRSVGYAALVAVAKVFNEKGLYDDEGKSPKRYPDTTGNIEIALFDPNTTSVDETYRAQDKNNFTYTGTSERIIIGNMNWVNGATHKVTQADIDEGDLLVETPDQCGDLLGTGAKWKMTVESTTAIRFEGVFPAQRSTEPYVYVRCNQTSNNLESACAQSATLNSKVIQSSDILGKCAVQPEFITYFAGADSVYFVNLHEKVLSKINLRLTDSRNRELPFTSGQTLNSGNLHFQCVLRLDIVQGTSPTTLDAPIEKPTTQGTLSNGVASFAPIRRY